MRRKAINLLRIVSKLMIISLYMILFVVQFINRSGAVYQSNPSSIWVNVSNAQTSLQKLYFKGDNLKKVNFHINKRFYPETLVALSFHYTHAPIIFRATVNLPVRKDYLLISSIITDSLRGPPVVIG